MLQYIDFFIFRPLFIINDLKDFDMYKFKIEII